MLCYMVELTLRYGNFLGGPNLIIQALKRRELSMAGSRRGIRELLRTMGIQHTVAGLKMERAAQEGIWVILRS